MNRTAFRTLLVVLFLVVGGSLVLAPARGVGTGNFANSGCTNVTTCNLTVTTSAGDALYVGVTTRNTLIAPASVQAHGLTFGLVKNVSIIVPNTVDLRIFSVDNVGGGSVKVFVNYTASTNYAMDVVALHNVKAVSLDAVGSGTVSITGLSTNVTDSVTTTAAHDKVLLWATTNTALVYTHAGNDYELGEIQSGNMKLGLFALDAAPIGASAPSATTSATTSWVAIALAVFSGPPPAPTGLAVVGTPTTTAVNLSWSNPVGAVSNVSLLQATFSSGSCGAYAYVASLGAVTSHTESGLTPGAHLCFEVQAWNSTGGSAASAPVTNVVLASTPGAGAAPTVLNVQETGANLTLTYYAGAGGIWQTSVYLGATCGSLTLYSSLSGLRFTFPLTGLTTDTLYCASYTAWNSSGEGARSGTLQFVTSEVPDPATSMAAARVAPATVNLTWTLPSGGGLLNVTLFQGAGCGTWTTATSLGSAVSAAQVSGLVLGGTYDWAVSVWNATGQSALSSCATVTLTNVSAAIASFGPNPCEVTLCHVQFNGTAAGGLNPWAFNWSWGDNSWTNDTGNVTGADSTAHDYLTVGTFLVVLTVWDAFGEHAAAFGNVTVEPFLFVVLGTNVSSPCGVLTALDLCDLTLYGNASQGVPAYALTLTVTNGTGALFLSANGSGNFTATVALPPGAYTLYLNVTDASGATVSVSSAYLVNLPAPPPPPGGTSLPILFIALGVFVLLFLVALLGRGKEDKW